MTYITKYCEYEIEQAGKKAKCGAELTEKIYNYSWLHYHQALCFGHQEQLREEMKEKYKEGLGSVKDWGKF